MAQIHLVPAPRRISMRPGRFTLPPLGWIVLEDSDAARDLFAAGQLALRLEAATRRPWKVSRDNRGVDAAIEIRCRQDSAIKHGQGYQLRIAPGGVELLARTAAGMFYAMQTLAQIAAEHHAAWPALLIDDWPDFDRRGVYHDTARGKVPELGTILQLVEDLAALKMNEFQLYVENAFEFRRHPQMYDDTTPLTAEELCIIDEACRRRHIDFIPSLTSLGHFERILNRPAFRKLAEAEPEVLKAQGIEVWSKDPWSLCVTDPAARRLLADMYDEFLPNFTSSTFNICCDEAWDLGKGRSKALADKVGVPQLYVDWINYCNTLSKKYGKKIMMWGDIIRQHPEKIPQIPEDATMIEWGYEANHDFEGRCKVFAASGRRFYVAPGTSGWQTFAGRTKNAFGNMRAAAAAGLRYGAAGFLNTDWGDAGHQQLLSVSLLPFAFGAAVSWNNKGTEDAGFLHAAGLHLFGDPTGKAGRMAYDLGMTYERIGHAWFNACALWKAFREPWEPWHAGSNLQPAPLTRTRNQLTALDKQMRRLRLRHPDGDLIREELTFTARSIIHAIDRELLRRRVFGDKKAPSKKELLRLADEAGLLTAEYESLWLARNKPSRMADVMEHFKRLEKEYRAVARRR